jgi:hypothetical protein
MPGLVVTMTGNNAGFTAMLNNSVAEAKNAGLAMQSNLRDNITAMEAKYAAMFTKPMANIDKQVAKLGTSGSRAEVSWLYMQRAALEKGALSFQKNIETEKLRLRLMGSTQAVAIAKAQAIEITRIAQAEAAAVMAATRVEQLAMLKQVATGGTASAFGAGGGAGGGISGMMRETLVIFREIGRGNMTRVPGSLLLLLQYTGLLNLMMKSEKTEALLAAAAQEKLAVSTARAAMAAEAKVRAAKIAAGMDVRGPDLIKAESEAADASAVAQTRRAEATAEAAASGNLSKEAAVANVVALEAERDMAVKDGVAQALRARETAAAAAVIKASAATTLAAMGLMVLPVLLLVAAIVAWYIAIKNSIGWLHKKNAAIAASMEIADKYATTIAEQIDFEEKLAEAIKKTTDALRKMNEAKNHSVELAQEATAAAKAEAEAQEKLNEAATKSKILDVEMAEKTGQITHREAVQQKADIEKQSLADKANAAQAGLDNEAAIAEAAAAKARTDKATAQQNFQAASDRINKSPEGVALKAKLADAEKIKKIAEEGIKDARKGQIESYTSGPLGGKNQKDIDAFKREQEAYELALKNSEKLIVKLKAKKSPAEIAEDSAETKANEATSASATLDETARRTAAAAATHAKNSPAEVAAQQANVQKQANIEKLQQAVTELAEAKKSAEQAKADLADAKKKGAPKDEIEALSRDFFSKKQSLESKTEPASVAGLQKAKDDLEKSKAELAAAKNRGAPQDEIAVLQRDFFAKNKGLMEMQGTENKPAGLNERQRLGAFTAQGGNPLVPLHQRTNSLLQQLVNNSEQRTKNTQALNGVQH